MKKRTMMICKILLLYQTMRKKQLQNHLMRDGKKGGGELKVMQVFDSVKEFKEAVLEYALKGGWNIKYTRWGTDKSEARCAVEGDYPCQWRIYCSYKESVGQWMVKTYQEEHICTKDGYCKLLTDAVIGKMFVDDIRKNPSLMPRAIQDQIQERYNLQVAHDICRKARKRALELIKDEFDEQFRKIKDYKNQILLTNQGSTVDLVTTIGEDGQEVFDRFHVCFKALRETWRLWCRPIFGIDGCFLKANTEGQLLAAVGRDANNQIYPIAWAVVKVENTDTWEWFIQNLKKDLDLRNGDGYTLISDKQKGLVKAVDQELPNVEHRMCARHTYGNLKKAHPHKPEMKKLFWAVSNSYNKGDYKAAMKKLKEYDKDVYESLLMRNPKVCSRAYFKTTSHCEDALKNFSESYNSALEKSRSMPLVEMLETMIHIDVIKQKIKKHKSLFTPKVRKMIDAEEKEKKWCIRIPGPNSTSEVREKDTSHTVNITMRTCSCRRWDVTSIPCRHALKVIMDKKLNPEDYVSHRYLTSTWEMQYTDSINPVEGMKFWEQSEEPPLQAPPRETPKGRKKNPPTRMKSVTESPTKGKKVTRHTRVMHCSRCGSAGHNATKCTNAGVPLKPRVKRKKTQEAEDCSFAFDDGPPQPTQPTQSS